MVVTHAVVPHALVTVWIASSSRFYLTLPLTLDFTFTPRCGVLDVYYTRFRADAAFTGWLVLYRWRHTVAAWVTHRTLYVTRAHTHTLPSSSYSTSGLTTVPACQACHPSGRPAGNPNPFWAVRHCQPPPWVGGWIGSHWRLVGSYNIAFPFTGEHSYYVDSRWLRCLCLFPLLLTDWAGLLVLPHCPHPGFSWIGAVTRLTPATPFPPRCCLPHCPATPLPFIPSHYGSHTPHSTPAFGHYPVARCWLLPVCCSFGYVTV